MKQSNNKKNQYHQHTDCNLWYHHKLLIKLKAFYPIKESETITHRIMVLKARFQEDALLEIGIDEAGRGSFWGPIMAGAVILPLEQEWTVEQRSLFEQLRDSKKLTPKKREMLYESIKKQIPFHAVGQVNAEEINQKGIQWANREAFRRAFQGLPSCIQEEPVRLLIDGVLAIDDWKDEQQLIVEGDSLYLSIAAASILAKVEHDHWIQNYCEDHPECNERYELVKNKGYGTIKHREGIRLYGAHELHRELYIQRWLPGSTVKPKIRKTKALNEESCLIRFD